MFDTRSKTATNAFLILYILYLYLLPGTFLLYHSTLRDSAGFALAVFMARYATVIHAIITELIIANKKTEAPNGIL